jgi:hypothetical protein
MPITITTGICRGLVMKETRSLSSSSQRAGDYSLSADFTVYKQRWGKKI